MSAGRSNSLRSNEAGERTSRSLSLTTGGVTLLSVLLGVGVTVALGIEAVWWVRVLAGLGTTVLLVLGVKLGSSAGHGPLARLANWVLGPGSDPGR